MRMKFVTTLNICIQECELWVSFGRICNYGIIIIICNIMQLKNYCNVFTAYKKSSIMFDIHDQTDSSSKRNKRFGVISYYLYFLQLNLSIIWIDNSIIAELFEYFSGNFMRHHFKFLIVLNTLNKTSCIIFSSRV